MRESDLDVIDWLSKKTPPALVGRVPNIFHALKLLEADKPEEWFALLSDLSEERPEIWYFLEGAFNQLWREDKPIPNSLQAWKKDTMTGKRTPLQRKKGRRANEWWDLQLLVVIDALEGRGYSRPEAKHMIADRLNKDFETIRSAEKVGKKARKKLQEFGISDY